MRQQTDMMVHGLGSPASPYRKTQKSFHLCASFSLQQKAAGDLLWGKILQVLGGSKALIRSCSNHSFLSEALLLSHLLFPTRQRGWLGFRAHPQGAKHFLSNRVCRVKQAGQLGGHAMQWAKSSPFWGEPFGDSSSTRMLYLADTFLC